jgi:hypothetical protein
LIVCLFTNAMMAIKLVFKWNSTNGKYIIKLKQFVVMDNVFDQNTNLTNYPYSNTHEEAHICGFYKVWLFDFLMVSFLVNLSHDIIMQSLFKRYESKVFCGILYVWI